MATPLSILCSRRLREATIATLLDRTDAADRVYPTPIVPWRRERPLPALGVYTLSERATPLGSLGNMGPVQLRESCELSIDVLVELVADPTATVDERLRLDVQTALDELCEQVMTLLLSTPSWVAQSEGVTGWERRVTLADVTESDRRTAAATITATLTDSCVFEPEIADEFHGARVKVDVIDPAADPNTPPVTEPPDGYPGGFPGPDGRIEVEFTAPGPDDPPLWPATVNGTAKEG